MTPAEREALRTNAKLIQVSGTLLAVSPEKVISMLDLISSLELTLSNANSAEALQVGQIMDQTARINKLEKALRDCLEYIDIPRESCFDDSQLGRAYDLLAVPTEPTPVPSDPKESTK